VNHANDKPRRSDSTQGTSPGAQWKLRSSFPPGTPNNACGGPTIEPNQATAATRACRNPDTSTRSEHLGAHRIGCLGATFHWHAPHTNPEK